MCLLQVCFEVRVLEKLRVTVPETETNPHAVRVGWSVDRANLQVSEGLWVLDPSNLTTPQMHQVEQVMLRYNKTYSVTCTLPCYLHLF